MNGNPIGPTQQVNLNPGMATELDFNPNRYTKSGRQKYVPQITPNNPTGGPGASKWRPWSFTASRVGMMEGFLWQA